MVFTDPTSPFHATVTDGDDRLVVIAGENASGKSLAFRILAHKVAATGALPITLSIRERCGAGTADMARMRQVMMFGDEAEQSTGATSVKTIAAAFRSNLDRAAGCVLGLDEPELGLSDGYARALGELIGTNTASLPDTCSGVIVVTHSRTLVAAMVAAYGATPTFLHCGPGASDLATWLDTVETRTVDELLALPDIGLERWRAVNTLTRP
jgi:antitoxin component of RelBE/YafQ-DinJ toxin-antitoxin module